MLLVTALLTTVSAAQAPDGYGVDSALPTSAVRLRSGLALAPDDGQWVSQTTLAARHAPSETLFLTAQLPWLIAGSSGPDDVPLSSGVGQLRLGLGRPLALAEHLTVAVGGEVGVPVAYLWEAKGWVEAPYTAQRGTDAMARVHTTWAPPDGTALTLRLAAGWRWSPDLPARPTTGHHQEQLEGALAAVVPSWGPSAVVFEGRVLTGPTPLGGVWALRVGGPADLTADVGVHGMVGSPMKGELAFGPVLQLRQPL